jgi:hypothetical protein
LKTLINSFERKKFVNKFDVKTRNSVVSDAFAAHDGNERRFVLLASDEMDTILERNQINIEDEMRRSYLDYAMSVIIGRALPDVRDGLKARSPPRALGDARTRQHAQQAV